MPNHETQMQCLARVISYLIEEPERGLVELRNMDARRRADILCETRYWWPIFRMVCLLYKTDEVGIAEMAWRGRNPLSAVSIPDMTDLCEMLDQTQLLRFTHMAQVAGLLEVPE